VISGLVKIPEQWYYSSSREYSGLKSQKFCNIDLASDMLDLIANQFSNPSGVHLDEKTLLKIWYI
jgi:hypothetical protein